MGYSYPLTRGLIWETVDLCTKKYKLAEPEGFVTPKYKEMLTSAVMRFTGGIKAATAEPKQLEQQNTCYSIE